MWGANFNAHWKCRNTFQKIKNLLWDRKNSLERNMKYNVIYVRVYGAKYCTISLELKRVSNLQICNSREWETVYNDLNVRQLIILKEMDDKIKIIPYIRIRVKVFGIYNGVMLWWIYRIKWMLDDRGKQRITYLMMDYRVGQKRWINMIKN